MSTTPDQSDQAPYPPLGTRRSGTGPPRCRPGSPPQPGGPLDLAGLVAAAALLARDALGDVLEDAPDEIATAIATDVLAWGRHGAALNLAQAILMDAVGSHGHLETSLSALVQDEPDGAAAARGVWSAFLAVGAVVLTGDDDGEEVEADDVHDAGTASRSIGIATALIGLAGGGQDALARALAESMSASLFPALGAVACLALLESDDVAPSADEARRVCHEAIRQWLYNRAGIKKNAERLLGDAKRAAARLGGGPGAGEAALEILARWLPGV